MVCERPEGFRATHLLDPALPWVVIWGSVEVTDGHAPAWLEAHIPFSRSGPATTCGIRSLRYMALLETGRVLELSRELAGATARCWTGNVLVQLDRRPGHELPEGFSVMPPLDQAAIGAACGAKLRISDEEWVSATAFDDVTLTRLRERYLAIEARVDPAE